MSESTVRKRGRRGSPESWSVDTHVGQRVRMRRTLLGMSQEKLGEAIGLTFQQVQKYERGSNRISAGTLFRLGQVLDVPVSFFFDSYEDPQGKFRSRPVADGGSEDSSVISRREARLLRLWRAAPPAVADEMLALLSALSPHLREAREAEDLIAILPQDTRSAQRSDEPRRAGSKEPRRRRHGAVWDPADIMRAAKGETRS
ncbi:helix-turn-helix transcriptional regulator [Azospirillum sp.]|uniref:helix-turn-helix transcriptional regulator n=1 Tax=Azospirillum sp. TaxID=34012 RepID=UPI002D4250CF|nr:helix-turn-helix transcriptional regulator [Azospirillum sp.]HYD70991.1 helix-turn-helix transcriptional regulator [Azospirillum sp.]